jgi:lysophospholipase L1-like esterase
MKRLLSGPLLALASVLAGLLLAELAARALATDDFLRVRSPNFPWMTIDPVLRWTLTPGYVHPSGWRINSDGFRGAEIGPKAAGTLRIVCLGDSGTFGISAAGFPNGQIGFRWETYVDALRHLAAARPEVEVINAGVPGSTSSHALRLLRAKVLELEPDIVVLRVGLNDHKALALAPWQQIEESEGWASDLFYAFADWQLVRIAIAARQRLLSDPVEGPMTTLGRFRSDLEHFAALRDERAFRLLLVDYPLRRLELPEPAHYANVYKPAGSKTLRAFHRTHERYQQMMANVARERDIPVARTRKALSSTTDPAFDDADFVHPNAAGAEATARTIWEELLRLGWIAPPDD